MPRVAKIILFVDDHFFFSVKKVPTRPDSDRRLELPGGHVENGETPLRGLIRELAEEEEGAFVADKVTQLQLTPVQIRVDDDRHFLYHMPIAEEDLEKIRMNTDESYGYRLIHRSTIMDPEQMNDTSLFTRRTVKIFAELRRLGHFPYDRDWTEPRRTKSNTLELNAMPTGVDHNTLYGEKYPIEMLAKDSNRLNKIEATLTEFERDALQGAYKSEELKPFQAELIKLQEFMEREKRRMIILFEGRDAAGKGGAIRRVTRFMNPKHYRVVALGKPTEEERSQWYYQKYIAHFPRGGEIVLFDRSWYNRAMVERVFGFCTPKEYEDFMTGVGWFEKDLVDQGTILVKLYFSVTMDEQARRFEARINDPLRQWKFSEIDREAQERWGDFTQVKYEMLKRTDTHWAPWTVIRSDDKHRARLNAIKVILTSVPFEKLNSDLDILPDPEIIISGRREIELMDAELSRTGMRTF